MNTVGLRHSVVSRGRLAPGDYPLITLVSYIDTPGGVVTSIYRKWRPRDGLVCHHSCAYCCHTGGHCLIQVRGRVAEEDAPLFDPDRDAADPGPS